MTSNDRPGTRKIHKKEHQINKQSLRNGSLAQGSYLLIESIQQESNVVLEARDRAGGGDGRSAESNVGGCRAEPFGISGGHRYSRRERTEGFRRRKAKGFSSSSRRLPFSFSSTFVPGRVTGIPLAQGQHEYHRTEVRVPGKPGLGFFYAASQHRLGQTSGVGCPNCVLSG